jgi:phosphatidylserine/phosphatidylglycerophosphate/cardiolipin synthase-like enzyme
MHPSEDLACLDRFKEYGATDGMGFPAVYPPNLRQFYAPVDDIPGVLRFLLSKATESLNLCMYGFADRELADIIKSKLMDGRVYVQLTLDSTQAAGKHEREILAREDYPSSSIAIGRSEKGAIVHVKELIIDGLILATGSTNWSASGETRQDNSLTVINDPAVAALAANRINAIHANILRVKP